MAAFNYRQLIRQIPARTWEFYFQSRKLELPGELAGDKLVSTVIDIMPSRATRKRTCRESRARAILSNTVC